MQSSAYPINQNLNDNPILSAYQAQGFYHAKNLIPKTVCEGIISCFNNDIKPYNGLLLRQRSVIREKHKFTKNGFMENALLDVHRKDLFEPSRFPKECLQLFKLPAVTSLIRHILDAEPLLVQSMYFESSKGTPEHFDKFFLDAKTNTMLGIWIALEDIEERNGRFYIYPGSHNHHFNTHPNGAELRSLFQHYETYNRAAVCKTHDETDVSRLHSVIECKRSLKKLIRQANWKKFYPLMKAGDAIIFSGDILHGSDVPSSEHSSRSSLTGHFMRSTQTNIRYGEFVEPINRSFNEGVWIHQSNRY